VKAEGRERRRRRRRSLGLNIHQGLRKNQKVPIPLKHSH
jgi:hypothetical protein